MEISEIRETVCETLLALTENEVFRSDKVTDTVLETPFEDFGMDSLDSMELVTLLEEEFVTIIDDDEAEKWKNANDVIDYLKNRLE